MAVTRIGKPLSGRWSSTVGARAPGCELRELVACGPGTGMTGAEHPGTKWTSTRYGELFGYDTESGLLVLGSDPAKVG